MSVQGDGKWVTVGWICIVGQSQCICIEYPACDWAQGARTNEISAESEFRLLRIFVIRSRLGDCQFLEIAERTGELRQKKLAHLHGIETIFGTRIS